MPGVDTRRFKRDLDLAEPVLVAEVLDPIGQGHAVTGVVGHGHALQDDVIIATREQYAMGPKGNVHPDVQIGDPAHLLSPEGGSKMKGLQPTKRTEAALP